MKIPQSLRNQGADKLRRLRQQIVADREMIANAEKGIEEATKEYAELHEFLIQDKTFSEYKGIFALPSDL